jgi:hypothetical protein
MSTIDTLGFLAVGALLGAAGQGVRALVGLKKERDATPAGKSWHDWFNGAELAVSFLLGAIAGIVAAISLYEPNVQLTRSMLTGFAGAGYAGADFIGGVLGKWLPKT